ncbi:hypothetical protein CAPTEDRAFT_19786 [Capitella teleta]|uniref:Innexin n=1 Tax=Capitella teleta TaxID=283909 RepID=R7TLR9_CAPTE|nr:hypothetical protein CAPTEDRAFT_19786 [Capitella teleta]|eukprot:ELT94614.1 hypothetical protein CAPTEDRAFT_19786 [Capitella teleta]
MDEILDATNGFLGLKGKKDDDFIDRLSSRYTVVLILVFSAIVTFYQFGGTLITCWCPVHFTDSHIKFTTSHCWVKNTYYLPYEDEIPREDEEGRQMIPYYQWIPFILLFQALFFYLPSLVWHSLNQKGGIDSDNILSTANTLHKTDQEENRENMLRLLTGQIHRFLGTRKTGQHSSGAAKGIKVLLSSICSMCGRRVGSYLVLLYLASKLLYIFNIIMQLFMLDKLLGSTFHDYGINVIRGTWSDDDWHSSPGVVFPRVAMCDLNVRRLGNVHRYTVQCALPLNMFNEKIYVFLWFWFMFVLVLSLLGFFTWLIRSLFPGDRLLFIQNHLRMMDKMQTAEEKDLSRIFVHEYLRQDGCFILRLISHNTNNITTSDVTCGLWENWLARYRHKLPLDKEKKALEEDEPFTKGDMNANASSGEENEDYVD